MTRDGPPHARSGRSCHPLAARNHARGRARRRRTVETSPRDRRVPMFARGDGSPARAVERTGILDLGLPTGGTVRDGVACRSDDALANAPGARALVLGSIVLQHSEAARGMILIARLLDRVAEDGVAVP